MNSTIDIDNNHPNEKVTIKEEFQDYYEIEKKKDYIISKFGGTKRTILSTIISSIYNLTFFVLLLYYNEKHYEPYKGFDNIRNEDCVMKHLDKFCII